MTDGPGSKLAGFGRYCERMARTGDPADRALWAQLAAEVAAYAATSAVPPVPDDGPSLF